MLNTYITVRNNNYSRSNLTKRLIELNEQNQYLKNYPEIELNYR